MADVADDGLNGSKLRRRKGGEELGSQTLPSQVELLHQEQNSFINDPAIRDDSEAGSAVCRDNTSGTKKPRIFGRSKGENDVGNNAPQTEARQDNLWSCSPSACTSVLVSLAVFLFVIGGAALSSASPRGPIGLAVAGIVFIFIIVSSRARLITIWRETTAIGAHYAGGAPIVRVKLAQPPHAGRTELPVRRGSDGSRVGGGLRQDIPARERGKVTQSISKPWTRALSLLYEPVTSRFTVYGLRDAKTDVDRQKVLLQFEDEWRTCLFADLSLITLVASLSSPFAVKARSSLDYGQLSYDWLAYFAAFAAIGLLAPAWLLLYGNVASDLQPEFLFIFAIRSSVPMLAVLCAFFSLSASSIFSILPDISRSVFSVPLGLEIVAILHCNTKVVQLLAYPFSYIGGAGQAAMSVAARSTDGVTVGLHASDTARDNTSPAA